MKPKLTRRGALSVTSSMDDLASLIQHRHDVLGIPQELALDFAKKADTLSDIIELTAASNFPVEAAEHGHDEKPEADSADDDSKDKTAAGAGESLPNANGGFDSNAIADQKTGPHKQEADEPYMSGEFTQQEFSELRSREQSGTLPDVEKLAAEFPAFFQTFGRKSAREWDMMDGYSGFTAHVRQLDELRTEGEEIAAELEARAGDLLRRKSEIDAEVAKALRELTKGVKSQVVDEQGSIIMTRRTKLVEASAMLKIAHRKRTRNMVQKELLAAVTERYGEEVAAFISETQDMLREQRKTLAVTFEGIELLQRQRSAGDKTASEVTAGILDALTRFTEYLSKGWKKIVSKLTTATRLIKGAAKSVDRAHDDFVKAFQDIDKAVTASVQDKDAIIDRVAAEVLADDDESDDESDDDESDDDESDESDDDESDESDDDESDDDESDDDDGDDESDDDDDDEDSTKKASFGFDLFA